MGYRVTRPKSLAVGDVVLVAFPFSDGAAAKRRPALVLTLSDGYGDHLMLPITSNPQAADGIALTAGDMAEGTLAMASWIKPLKLSPVAASRVEKVLAKVRPAVLSKVRASLCPALGCV